MGYTCSRVWGPEGNPKRLMSYATLAIQPVLFGTVGSSLLISRIRSDDIGKSFAVIACGQVTRFLTVLVGTHTRTKLYTIKERIFIAFAYLPKSTTVATLASVIYTEAIKRGPEY